MKVIDIVNRDNQSLERCDQEPIHIPGSIQPHGFLISVDSTSSHIIRYCSENAADALQIKISEILNRPIRDILSADECLRLADHITQEQFDVSIACTLRNTLFNISVHKSGDLFTLEFEPFPDGSLSTADQFNQTKKFLRNIQQAENFQQICQSIAEETRILTGYDRVMIYRFDKDYNGEVYAESKRDGLDPFLGHHYPHTDIPAQARELYLRNLLRIIPDVLYTPVPVLTIIDGASPAEHLDMSYSVLRSVSPIHIEYLRNMKVGATLTISLIDNKRLWGLIACHHYGPKFVPFYTRLAAQLQGHLLTSQIAVREAAAENELSLALDRRLDDLLAALGHLKDFRLTTDVLNLITKLPNATGVAVIRNGVIEVVGVTPSIDQINKLLPWLIQHSVKGNYTTDSLSQNFIGAEDYGRDASGVLYHNLGNPQRDSIIWFRAEVEQVINWAGNPTKAVANDGVTPSLTPRKSFELWQEKVRHKSLEWKNPELNIAAKLAQILQRQFYSMYLEEEEKRYIELTESLKKANAELANINWIGTHDLKEPLRKIQIFATRILDAQDQASPMILDSAERMKKSATRMQTLITDLLQYSKINVDKSREVFQKVDLNVIVNDVITQLDEDIIEKKADIIKENLPVVKGISFQLSQLFVNLIDNSFKFSRTDRSPKIIISSTRVRLKDSTFLKVVISDNGIGIDSAHKNKIFEVFQRLHGPDFEGTGIGLAICKKVMENHGGSIAASGNEEGGTNFELYFPA